MKNPFSNPHEHRVLQDVNALSARLAYEPLQLAHAQTLCEALCDPRIHLYLNAPHPQNLSQLQQQFHYMLSRPDGLQQRWLHFAILHRASGQGVGRLAASVVHSRAEVAYLLGPNYWHQGYALEALHWLQGTLPAQAIRTLWASTRPDHLASVTVLLRAGFTEVFAGWPLLHSYEADDRVFCWRA
jgi:RimJ/RimL family protein N-acetyltransferase